MGNRKVMKIGKGFLLTGQDYSGDGFEGHCGGFKVTSLENECCTII